MVRTKALVRHYAICCRLWRNKSSLIFPHRPGVNTDSKLEGDGVGFGVGSFTATRTRTKTRATTAVIIRCILRILRRTTTLPVLTTTTTSEETTRARTASHTLERRSVATRYTTTTPIPTPPKLKFKSTPRTLVAFSPPTRQTRCTCYRTRSGKRRRSTC